MNKAIFKMIMQQNPEESKNKTVYIHDDLSLCQAICGVNKNTVFIGRDVASECYFTIDSFQKYLQSIMSTGTYLINYTFVLTCKRKNINDELKSFFKDQCLVCIEAWKLFRDKEYLSDPKYEYELKDILKKFEKRQFGDKDESLKSRFIIYGKNGQPSGILDKKIIDYLIEEHSMFIMMGSLYIYREGVYLEDRDGIWIKNIMQTLLYDDFVRARTLNNLYSLLMMQQCLQIKPEEINNYPVTWINFKNGMLDVETLTMHPHDKKYYAINQIPHNYDDSVILEKQWVQTQKFLKESCETEEDIEMLLSYFGYCMTRDTRQQTFMILKGLGGTGKSRLIHLLEYMIGTENFCNISLQDLNKRFYATSLFGKLLNSCADISSSALDDTDVIKKATGEDVLMYEKKGKDPGTFKSYAKLFFSANRIPLNLDEKSNAFYRRILIFEMNHIPEKKDVYLDKKLESEVEGTILVSVQALHQVYVSRSCQIKQSENSKALVNDLYKESDSVKAFLDDCIVEKAGRSIKRSELFNDYQEYCKENERVQYKKTIFFRNLEEKGYRLKKKDGVWFFDGISYKEEDFQEMDDVNYKQEKIPF